MLFGNQLRLVLSAFTPPNHPPELQQIIESVLREQRVSGTKGFQGDDVRSASSVQTTVRSAHPELPDDSARRVAEAAVGEMDRQKLKVQIWMRVVISIFALGAGVAMLYLKHDDQDLSKWATGLIGTVVGYWLS